MATDLRRSPAALDPLTFEDFYERHRREIFRYVLQDVGNRADAEEVTQTAFLDAFRALRRGHEPEQPRAWMYGIARNAARRRYRTQSRRPREVELGPAVLETAPAEDVTPWVEAVRAAFGGLRPNHREVVFLREVEGLSYIEIGRRMNLSQPAVETLLFRARRALREALEAEGAGPSVTSKPKRSLGGLALVPVFLGKLTGRAQQLLAPAVGTKMGVAVTAVALGTGMAVGTKSAVEAWAGSDATPAVALEANAERRATASAWVEPGTASPRGVATAEPKEKGKAKADRKGEEKQGKDDGTPGKRDDPQSGSAGGGGETSVVGGIVGSGSGGGTSVATPGVSVGSVEVPSVSLPDAPVDADVEVPELPPVSTPEVEIPPLEVEAPVDTGGLLGG